MEIADVRQGLALAGRGAGAQRGDWRVRVVDSADILDDQLSVRELREIGLRQGVRTAAHLLEPFDLVVAARSRAAKVALVPPGVHRTVAAVTLLVVRTPDPGTGLAHYLWYYLTSTLGRADVAARFTATSLPSLSARALGEVPVVVPPAPELLRIADLAEAAAASRRAALEAVRVRHDVIRDAVVAAAGGAAQQKEGGHAAHDR